MKRMTTISAVVAFAVTSQSLPLAAQGEGKTRAIPTGMWSAPCEAFNQAAICTTRWSAGLKDRTMAVQSYRIEHAETGKLLFEGRGVYRLKGKAVDGYWEDSSGNIHKLSGSWNGEILDVHWGELGNGGRSQYEFSPDELETTDWVLKPAGWLQFMNVGYGPRKGE